MHLCNHRSARRVFKIILTSICTRLKGASPEWLVFFNEAVPRVPAEPAVAGQPTYKPTECHTLFAKPYKPNFFKQSVLATLILFLLGSALESPV